MLKTDPQYPPGGWRVVDSYTPCHTVTPYDYYGLKHQREIVGVLNAAGIECKTLEQKRRRLNPIGTGPGGRVRFGDDMVPSTYEVCVKKKHVTEARRVIEHHQARSRRFYNEDLQ